MTARIVFAGASILGVSAAAHAQPAMVSVRFEPASLTAHVDDQFSINIVADFTVPIYGWGLDLSLATPNVISELGPPTIGPLWSPGISQDGDGLAGLAFPNSVIGSDVLLATLSFRAQAHGGTDLLLSYTPGDITEGFALDPTGFATVQFAPGHVTVLPEPASAALVGLSYVILGVPRRRRRIEPSVGSGDGR